MKIQLVNDNGQAVAQVNDVEKYDGTLPGHTAGLLDLLETLIASAKKMNESASKPALHMVGETICERLSA